MAVLPPLPRMLFWIGYVTEQVLVVNVAGFSLVLIRACGHPRIEQILGVTERVLDVPIRAVVGGLHLPVHAAGTPLVPEAVLGNPHPPWQPISERDAEQVLQEIQARGPKLVALSRHDSTSWTYGAFARRFGDRYRPARGGRTADRRRDRVTRRGTDVRKDSLPASGALWLSDNRRRRPAIRTSHRRRDRPMTYGGTFCPTRPRRGAAMVT